MPSRHLSKTSLRLAMRICDRIQQQDGAQNPALPSAALLHVAYWIVRFAVCDSPDPVAAAFCRIFETPDPPPVQLCPMFAAIETISMVDGRTAMQWFLSIIHYLEWRSGVEWRSGAQRVDDDRDCYLIARRLLRECFYSSTPAAAAQLPPKMPARSVRLARAMTAG